MQESNYTEPRINWRILVTLDTIQQTCKLWIAIINKNQANKLDLIRHKEKWTDIIYPFSGTPPVSDVNVQLHG